MVEFNEHILNLYSSLESDLVKLIPQERFSKDVNMKLERISHLMEVLGNPHHSFPSIHVGGTSGKGSTSIFLASILTTQGYKTGLFLSPHLQIINEAYQINCKLAATTKLVEIFERVKSAIAKVAQENIFGQPSYFEAQVALAFCLFEEQKVDVAIIEVGLGGRLDATNILSSTIAVLTSVGLDHTEILGSTVEEIAEEKAGIIKAHQHVVCGFSKETTREIVAQRCEKSNSQLWQLEQDFSFTVHSGSLIINLPGKVYENLSLTKLIGEFQFSNAACATAAAYLFSQGNLSDVAVREGLADAIIPGRMEILQTQPVVILDGAHNPDKMRSASHSVHTLFGGKEKVVIVSFKKGKPVADILPYLIDNVKCFILTAFQVKGLWEPYPPEELKKAFNSIAPSVPCFIVDDPINAVQEGLSRAENNDLVWITGSLYLAGDAREHWYPSASLLMKAEE
ncbi:MAG: bifunctional folylpolyglutamate synthase/dihydrofolate synthase [Symploca sp. SIO1B1]|nr:bifunctional folylpolyglutamate synthase/dihydrofolate synthase [Symploca sp. SIO1A3]NER99502.1 bifunctional folylpolyglutamate synthase/dihydrofolate synthase [Symploca sp. SIO1B1]